MRESLVAVHRPIRLAPGCVAARWPAFAAVLLGLTLLFGVGFAQPAALHQAAHDVRHAAGFPCH